MLTRSVRSALFCVVALCWNVAPARAAAPAPELGIDADEKAGFATLSWTSGGSDITYELETSSAPSFATAQVEYRGRNTSSVVSGLPNGTRHYRVRARAAGDSTWSPWSAPQTLAVDHHSRLVAGSLFVVGAIVFLLTGAFILVESRRAAS